MNKLLVLFFLLSFKISFSQEGKFYLKSSEARPGFENLYGYEPPHGLSVPENAVVRIVYDFVNPKQVSLIKKANKYEFSVKLPDSVNFVLFRTEICYL